MMLPNIAIGCTMIVLTAIIHAWGMSAAMRWLRMKRREYWKTTSITVRSLAIAVLALIMFVATVIEAGVWAAVYIVVGSFMTIEEALYFSMVTYTTLGFGDIVMEERWRLLSSFEAANGIIMFGWTTALIVVGIHRVSRHLDSLD